MGVQQAGELQLLTWLFPWFLYLLRYFGACFNFFPGKPVMVAKSPVNSGPLHPPTVTPAEAQLPLLRKTKTNPASATPVIPIFVHLLLVCAVCMLFRPAFHLICCCHRLQRGTKFTFKSNLKQNEKARKSWKRKLVTAINMDLPAGPFTVAIKCEQEDSAPACSCWGFDPGHKLLSIRGTAPQKSPKWLLAASCRQPCMLLNAAGNGSAPLSLITVAIPRALQEHRENRFLFMSHTKFRMEGSGRKWQSFLRARMLFPRKQPKSSKPTKFLHFHLKESDQVSNL